MAKTTKAAKPTQQPQPAKPELGRVQRVAPSRQTQTVAAPKVSGILAADIGSVHTRVSLFDLVAGQYRLIGRAQALTTAAPRGADVEVGLRRALAELGTLIGRPLLDMNQNIWVGEGAGADVFVATASGGRPMRAVLVGLMNDISLESGQRALASTYVELIDTLSMLDVRSVQDKVNSILRGNPDLILIVGGTDGGATAPMLDLLNVVTLAARLSPTQLVVLYAGNAALVQTVRDRLEGQTTLYIAENVRPDLSQEDYESVRFELSRIYGGYRAANTPGFTGIQERSEFGVLPAVESYSTILRYVAEGDSAQRGALCIDVGSSTVTVCANVRGKQHVAIRSDLGLGHSAVTALQAVGVKNVLRWLSFEATEDEITDYVWNKTLHPATVPETQRDLEIEYALVREAIRSAVATAREAWGAASSVGLPPLSPVIGMGSALASPVNPGLSALLLLDALQPVGVTAFRLDPYSLMAALGSIAYVEPLAVVQVLETGGLTKLGTAICPAGRTGSGTAIEAAITFENGRKMSLAIPSGELRAVALGVGQKAALTLKLGRGLTLNGKNRVALTVEGGTAGLLFDARPRPLTLPKDVAGRAALLPKWYAAVQAVE